MKSHQTTYRFRYKSWIITFGKITKERDQWKYEMYGNITHFHGEPSKASIKLVNWFKRLPMPVPTLCQVFLYIIRKNGFQLGKHNKLRGNLLCL